MRRTQCRRSRAFTLIELLVVVAVIAILIGVLLPALGTARRSAQTIKCAANARTIGQGVATYVVESGGYFPPSYVYGSSNTGGKWKVEDQQETNPNPTHGYVHWSYAIFEGDEAIKEDAFSCPTVNKGGAPKTNPGPNEDDWEPGQKDDTGGTQGSTAEYPNDRQARRIAYTGNAAIFPRNKFMPTTPRKNRLVKAAEVGHQSRTILATEFLFLPNWVSLGDGNATNNFLVKSHRPVTPFVGGSTGTDVYNESDSGGAARFFYPNDRQIYENSRLGAGMIEDRNSILNAVGRHHPSNGFDSRYGGTANFVFVDGHVERYNVLETVKLRLWGNRFFCMSGNNKVDDAF